MSRWQFAGVTVAATGGPLALAAGYVPNIFGDVLDAPGAAAALGIVFFVPLVAVWLSYSRTIVGAGGLTSFVEVAVGRRVALGQAALWVASYLLYLAYTVTYLTYDVIAVAFPGLGGSWRPVVQLVLAFAIAAVALLPTRHAVAALCGSAILQVLLAGALAVVALLHVDAASRPNASSPTGTVLLAGANTALLFICASLPLFLGGEVRGGSRDVRPGLTSGWLIAAVVTAAAAVPLVTAAPALTGGSLPAVAAAQSWRLPVFADVLTVGVVISIAGLVVIELWALSRLLHATLHQPIGRLTRVLAVVLVGASAVLLVDPERLYADLLKPSLICLWLAQLVVFVVYPAYIARRARLRAADVALAASASALMVFGLWSTFQQPGT